MSHRSVAVVVFHLLLSALATSPVVLGAGPRVEVPTTLEDVDPYYPYRGYPKLITPQWVGEPGVEAVVVLAIDDMSDSARYEAFLRPILSRLKAIDGRAPVSIMANRVIPDDPRLQTWLKEGLSIEVHTLTHPCPCLQKGDFEEAERTYHGCVDMMARIPGNKPVAFRMPCCDSMNSPSPRFFAEIFNRTSPRGRALTIDSSVFMLFTPDDPDLPRELVLDRDGKERFGKYLPFRSFVNTIENYPYPYVIGGVCWEFPCVVPSDWEAQNLHGRQNPRTVEDLKAALDLVVLKKGVFNLVFHPHDWIKNTQVVELIDHAVKTHGEKVKFLTFREARERLDKSLFDGGSLRSDAGEGPRARLIDLDSDGYLDVVRLRDLKAKVWQPRDQDWVVAESADYLKDGLPIGRPLPYPLPGKALVLDERGRDAGLRLVDLDEDGHRDVVYSNDRDYGIYLFDPAEKAWSRKVMAGKAGEPGSLPKIVRDGKNNGFFVHSRHLWWQNEDTANLPDLVDRRSFNELLKGVEPRAKSPQASLESIRVKPGFKVELMACEPLVNDPIAFEWGADGKLWVVEMGDYPLGVDGRGKPGGVVRVLEDRDGDGGYDKATTFLDGLGFPTGVMPWRQGVLISCAPDILYAEDRDGDGRADHREVLFTGFVEGNQQHRLNGFELGLDGWVYGANGDSGGTVRSTKTGRSVDINGRDFRFNPDTGEFEAESGRTQFGRHQDDWGRWFGNNNPTWAWHFVLSESDLARNLQFVPPDPRHVLEPRTALFPISRTPPRFNDPGAANHLTSANSPTPYRDELFGPGFENSLFVSEPVHNLVHRMVLEPSGATLAGRRGPGEDTREFLASSDNWFRPTMLKTGPDGGLWIADMYRAVIEHPEWIPDDWEARLDLRAGASEGRIYRVSPIGRTPRLIPQLEGLDTPGLVAALDAPGGWQRDSARRLLLHKRDPAAIPLLRGLAERTTRPQTRVPVLWTLAVLKGLDSSTTLAALADPHPQVRRNAIRASSSLWRSEPQVAEGVLKLVDDGDAQVRLELALGLGNWEDPRAGKALAKLARRDGNDPWIRTAILSSSTPHAATLLAELFRDGERGAPPALVETLMGLTGSSGDTRAVDSMIDVLKRPDGQGGRIDPWKFLALAKLLESGGRSGLRPGLERDPRLSPIREEARRLLADDSAPDAGRLAAIRLIGRYARADRDDREALAGLLRARVSIAIQQAAVEALAKVDDPGIPPLWLRGWKGHSPQVRAAIFDGLLTRGPWIGSLLDAIQDGRLAAAEIDPFRRQVLLNHPDAAVRARASALLAQLASNRREVVEAHRSALAMKGDATAGATVFQRLCTSCHRLANQGYEVGPDLATLADKSPEALLVAILDPDRAFEAKYGAFAIATRDGRVVTGLVSSESANGVTLRRQEAKEDTFLRSEIEEVAASGHSFMPEGLEKDLKPRDLADLFAFLAASDSPAKSFPGNQPRVVKAGADGSILLSAADAEIRGETLVFESRYGNLGYWASANDRASWTFEVERPGRYAVWVDHARPGQSTEDRLEILEGSQSLRYAIRGTGSWDVYRADVAGILELTAGTHRLVARPAGPLRNALLDLKTIELRPIEALRR